MVPETDWRETLPFLKTLMDDRETRALLSHVGVQSSVEPNPGADAVYQLVRRHNFNLWQTQFTSPGGNSDEMDDALELAQTVLADLLRGCRAWLYGPIFATEAQPGRLGLLEGARHRIPRSQAFPRPGPVQPVHPQRRRPGVRNRRQRTGGGFPQPNQASTGCGPGQCKREDAVDEEVELRGYRLEDIEVVRTSADEDNRAAEPAPEAGSRLRLTLAPRSINTLRAINTTGALQSAQVTVPCPKASARQASMSTRFVRLSGSRRPTADFEPEQTRSTRAISVVFPVARSTHSAFPMASLRLPKLIR